MDYYAQGVGQSPDEKRKWERAPQQEVHLGVGVAVRQGTNVRGNVGGEEVGAIEGIALDEVFGGARGPRAGKGSRGGKVKPKYRNPATGELQYTSLSPADEKQLGREEHPKALAEFGGQQPHLVGLVGLR